MKVVKASAGALTNLEVLDFLRSRGASTDPTRVIAHVARSEFEVYDYLVESAAFHQTRENIDEFMKKCEKYDLAKAEKLNIVNIRPSSLVEIDPLIEDCDKRFSNEEVEEIVEMVVNVFPSPVVEQPEAATDEGKEDIPDSSTMEDITAADKDKEQIPDSSTMEDITVADKDKEQIPDTAAMED